MDEHAINDAMRIVANRDRCVAAPQRKTLSASLQDRARLFCVRRTRRELAALGVHPGDDRKQ